MDRFSLLSNCTSGGCGAKIGPGDLAKILDGLPQYKDENLIVGYDSSDDAAVYNVNGNLIVSTVDFFPPMVDDPYTFGKIAAANALSDIYAMGAKPVMALNLVCFPEKLDIDILRAILEGGAQKIKEAQASVAGGHSIYDREIKYGLAVTGIAGGQIIRNNTPRMHDKLILTKRLGVGIIMAAMRGEAASKEAVEKAVKSMERLNRYAAEKMCGYKVNACTDITGFGLLTHLAEMAGNTVSIRIYPDTLPYFEEAYEYAGDYLITAAGQRNRNHMNGKCNVKNLPFPIQELMFDPQTSGGLLISVDNEDAGELLKEIQTVEPHALIIGEVIKKDTDIITIRGDYVNS